jgi:hypothetical protein
MVASIRPLRAFDRGQDAEPKGRLYALSVNGATLTVNGRKFGVGSLAAGPVSIAKGGQW